MYHWRGNGQATSSATALGVLNLRRIARLFRPYKGKNLGILACLSVTSVLGLVPALLIRTTLDSALPQHDMALLNLLILGMVAAAIAGGLVGVLQSYLNSMVSQGIMYDLRNQMYQRLQMMSLRFYTSTKTGEVMARITSDVGGIQGVISGTLVSAMSNVITLITTLALMFALSWQLALIALFVLPWLVLPTRKVGGIRRSLRLQRQQQHAEMNAMMQETLSVGGAHPDQGLYPRGLGEVPLPPDEW